MLRFGFQGNARSPGFANFRRFENLLQQASKISARASRRGRAACSRVLTLARRAASQLFAFCTKVSAVRSA